MKKIYLLLVSFAFILTAGTMIPVQADNLHQKTIIELQAADQITETLTILQNEESGLQQVNYVETVTTSAGGYRESDILKCYGSDNGYSNEQNTILYPASQIAIYCNIDIDMRRNEELWVHSNTIAVDYPLILLYNHDQNRKTLTLRSRRIQPDRRV